MRRLFRGLQGAGVAGTPHPPAIFRDRSVNGCRHQSPPASIGAVEVGGRLSKMRAARSWVADHFPHRRGVFRAWNQTMSPVGRGATRRSVRHARTRTGFDWPARVVRDALLPGRRRVIAVGTTTARPTKARPCRVTTPSPGARTRIAGKAGRLNSLGGSQAPSCRPTVDSRRRAFPLPLARLARLARPTQTRCR